MHILKFQVIKIILLPLKLSTVQLCLCICQLIHQPSFQTTSRICPSLGICGLPEKVQFYTRRLFMALLCVIHSCLICASSSVLDSKYAFLGLILRVFLYLHYWGFMLNKKPNFLIWSMYIWFLPCRELN